jgi:hypothetical protein
MQAEIVDGVTWLCFDPGELGIRIGSDNRVELVPNCASAALALRQIRLGTLRPARGACVSLRIALDHGAAAFIEIRDGGEAGREGAGRSITGSKPIGT